QVQQARTAFEQGDLAVLEERHLPERLAREVLRPAVPERNRTDLVVESRLLARPAQPQVADEAARPGLARRHPVVGPDGQRASHVRSPMVRARAYAPSGARLHPASRGRRIACGKQPGPVLPTNGPVPDRQLRWTKPGGTALSEDGTGESRP